MTTTAGTATVEPPAQHVVPRPPRPFANITPNWFASVMGTGILATAAATLPDQFAGLHGFALTTWMLASVLLVVIGAATVLHWRRNRETARTLHLDPVLSHFYGAPPMALLTVGAGTLLVGRDVIGARLAVDVDWVLWFAGTLSGLATAMVIPYLVVSRLKLSLRDAFGGWLMSIVPPIVSASTGALLVPHAPAGRAQLTLLVACYAMFSLSLVASVIVISLICLRLVRHGVGPARLVPTWWIVLGPLGQSITAGHLLGRAAAGVAPTPVAADMRTFALGYGVPVWGFALLWTCLAGALTVRTAREHLPFSLTWWSFTFPVGTFVTGTTGLAVDSGSAALRMAAAVSFAALVGAWLVVAVRTGHGCVRGDLLAVPSATRVPVR